MSTDEKLPLDLANLDFAELENRYGRENACNILRTLEQFEGIRESDVARMPFEDRLRNVFDMMKEGLRYHTRH